MRALFLSLHPLTSYTASGIIKVLMNLDIFVNLFSPEDFTSSNEEGISQLRDKTLIYAKIRQLCAEHNMYYTWKPVQVGRHSTNGNAYFVGELTFFAADGTVTVPGVAEGATPDMGLSGVSTIALANALMRGLGAAEFQYEPDIAPTATRSGSGGRFTPPQPQQAPSGPATAQNGHSGGYRAPSRFNDAGGSHSKPQDSTWTGDVKVKSGEWAGTSFKSLPIEVLQKWASFKDPNKLAVLELDRRVNEEVPF